MWTCHRSTDNRYARDNSLFLTLSSFFFFNYTATTEIYTLSLHDALPIFVNLKAILTAASSRLDYLVKTTVFLARMEDFAEMNEVYARHAGKQPPARSTVQAAKLPAGALVEIEAVAHM